MALFIGGKGPFLFCKDCFIIFASANPKIEKENY